MITSLSFSSALLAWDATGHAIVAQIAYNNLTTIAKKDVGYLINKTHFASEFPQFTPYVYSASWPDYFKYKVKLRSSRAVGIFNYLQSETKAWHYYDQPIVIGNYATNPVSINNSIWAMHFLVPDLTKLLYQEKYDQAAYALIFITHIVGDMHQPLHNANLFDADFPQGDLGGNLYTIKKIYGAKNLHALWDISLGHFYYWRNYSFSFHPPQKNIKKIADQFQNLCEISRDLNPTNWEKDSHQIAVRYVYPFNNPNAPEVNQKALPTYIKKGRLIAAKQMCLAGKRLAAILNKIFVKPISMKGAAS